MKTFNGRVVAALLKTAAFPLLHRDVDGLPAGSYNEVGFCRPENAA